ncbi:MAG: glycosyl hydrolase family 18 protein [Prolixibacteraceae bacterium]
MKHLKSLFNHLFTLTFSLFILIQLGFVSSAFTQNSTKRITTWYIYQDGNTFADIDPYKDIIRSISVFGNLPKEFIAECHKNNIEVYHAVSGNEKTIDSAAKIKQIGRDYVEDCNMNGYDGIDLDFENLNPDVQNTYSEFLNEVSTALHKAGKKLSHCVGFYPTLYQDEVPKIFYNPKVVATTCDLVRVMCYDMYFAPGRLDKKSVTRDDCQGIGPTSNYSWTEDAMKFWIKYVPKDKLVMALPAYSNDYIMNLKGAGKQVYSSVPDSVKGILQSPTWLWYEKLNIYLYDDLKGNTHLFYASDQRSTKALLEIGDELKINNIGFWHFGSVDPKMWSVVREWINK